MGYGYFEYTPVSEKKARAKAALEKLRKKMPDIKPIAITGRKLARTWWGEAWNRNLESYRDFAYRLERGRSYVRHGAILHLAIFSGHIEALVQGSRQKPYEITITIDPLPVKVWNAITETCKGKIDSMQELLSGKFPKALSELFTQKDKGLFPSPKEIRLSCSCPDYASMCKHVSAAMYGIGARLDEDPSLFFLLRNVNVNELISEAIAQKSDELLTKAGKKSRRAIASDDLSAMFGIDLESDTGIKIDPYDAERAAESVVSSTVTDKKRGRPPKVETIASATAKMQTATGKRRGRPPKAEAVASEAAKMQTATGKRRGRPPKAEAVASEISKMQTATGKRRGRPPKAEAVASEISKMQTATGKRRGRPPKAETITSATAKMQAATGKRRGRPPKVIAG